MNENNSVKGISDINNVLSMVINEIEKGKDKIADIAQYLKDENEAQKEELKKIDKEILSVIEKVNNLEKKDKMMRKELAKASLGFNDKKIEIAYDNALNVRVEFVTLQNEEKRLQNYRRRLEMSIKKGSKNIEEANVVVDQVKVAMYYLTGNLSKELESLEVDSKYSLGIKIVEAQEREKSRIARDIHDGPAQYLASTLMRIDLCKSRLAQNMEEGLNELEDVRSNVKKTLKEVRNIIFDLRPPFFEGITLPEAIDDLKEAFEDESNIELKVTFLNKEISIPETIETAVYRVIQELLSNIKKHSCADSAYLRIEVTSLQINIIVKDNGIGFNVDEVIERCRKNNKNYGLIGIYERVDELGGTIEVNSVKQYGTEYKIIIPRDKGDKND